MTAISTRPRVPRHKRAHTTPDHVHRNELKRQPHWHIASFRRPSLTHFRVAVVRTCGMCSSCAKFAMSAHERTSNDRTVHRQKVYQAKRTTQVTNYKLDPSETSTQAACRPKLDAPSAQCKSNPRGRCKYVATDTPLHHCRANALLTDPPRRSGVMSPPACSHRKHRDISAGGTPQGRLLHPFGNPTEARSSKLNPAGIPRPSMRNKAELGDSSLGLLCLLLPYATNHKPGRASNKCGLCVAQLCSSKKYKPKQKTTSHKSPDDEFLEPH